MASRERRVLRAAAAVNLVLFQLGWLACVLGAASGSAWIGVFSVALLLAVHFTLIGGWRELPLVGLCLAMGGVFDTVLVRTGLVEYAAHAPWMGLAPAWILAMWASFATTIGHSLAWLRSRTAVGALFGAIGGPLAYWAASRLNAVELKEPTSAILALALIWSVSAVAIAAASSKLDPPPS